MFIVNTNCYREYQMKKRSLKKDIFFLMLVIITAAFFPSKTAADDSIPVNFRNLSGNWNLQYGNNYGYNFKFYKNYRAVVVLYLNTNAIVFKGVYNIESSDSVRINVSEMKREESVKNINLKGGFIKAKTSHFIFNVKITSAGGKKNLEMRPQKIFIDGSDSDGYFEPYIKLEYTGK